VTGQSEQKKVLRNHHSYDFALLFRELGESLTTAVGLTEEVHLVF
jgi:hypothetical protein